jgi:hypothetical protein
MLQRTLIAAMAFAIATTTLNAQVTETGSEQSNYAVAAGGGDSDGPHTSAGTPVYGTFVNTLSASAADSGETGFAMSDQDSSIAPMSYSANLATQSSAVADFLGATGIAESIFNVEFTVESPVDFNIVGLSTAVGGDSIASVKLVNIGVGGTPTQIFANLVATANGSAPFDVDGSLLPGDYRLEARSYSHINYVFDSGSNSTHASTDLTMTIVPEPSSMALLLVGGVAAIRRRNRRA